MAKCASKKSTTLKTKITDCFKALAEHKYQSVYISEDKTTRILMERTYIDRKPIIYITKQTWYGFDWHTTDETICFEPSDPVEKTLQLLGWIFI